MTKYHDQGLIKAIAIEIKRQTPKHIEVNKRYCLKKLKAPISELDASADKHIKEWGRKINGN